MSKIESHGIKFELPKSYRFEELTDENDKLNALTQLRITLRNEVTAMITAGRKPNTFDVSHPKGLDTQPKLVKIKLANGEEANILFSSAPKFGKVTQTAHPRHVD